MDPRADLARGSTSSSTRRAGSRLFLLETLRPQVDGTSRSTRPCPASITPTATACSQLSEANPSGVLGDGARLDDEDEVLKMEPRSEESDRRDDADLGSFDGLLDEAKGAV